jgi:hypothetical protein
MKYSVYVHTSPAKKVYVGYTSRKPKARWANGKGYTSNLEFAKDIEKYGWSNFIHEILAEVETKEEAEALEKFYIKKFKACDPLYGYNKSVGGPPCNKGLTEEEKKKRRYDCSRRWIANNYEHYIEKRRQYDRSQKRKDYVNDYNKTDARRAHRTKYMQEYRIKNREKIREINQRAYRKRHPIETDNSC